MTAVCQRCGRGREACCYCHDAAREDWEAMCDCGLYDFGAHLLDCSDRIGKRWVIAASYDEAQL